MALRIAVVGAGIAGLATAVALQRGGHHVQVVERRTDISSGAGISLWPNALAALDAIGLGEEVRTAGGRVSAGALRRSDGSWLRHPSPQRLVDALGEPLVVVHRAVLLRVLAGALRAGALTTGVAATGVTVTTDGAFVDLSDRTTVSVDAVVGADGVNSMVARHLNGALRHRYTGYTAWRGIAAHPLDPDLSGETLAAGVEFGHVPLGSEHTYWFATERAPQADGAAEGELTYLRRRFAQWAEPIPTLLATTRPREVLRTDLYDREQAVRWSRGPVVAVGDAAHPMRPHLGQGGCQGLEDAAILAVFLERAEGPVTAFARFEEFRRPRVAALVRESAMVGRVLNLRPAWLSGLANQATVLVPEAVLSRHLAAVAGRRAFRLPTASDVGTR